MTLKIANREFPGTAIGGMKMKKMLAACAAMMVAGLVSADITSDNIVGYTQKTSVSGFNWLAPMFNTVGLTSYSLSDITISDGAAVGEGVIGWGSENIQILDELGRNVATYTYLIDDAMEHYSWVDGSGNPVTTVFMPGDSLALSMDTADIACTVAGEVPDKDVTITTRGGFTFTGNSFPADISINDITISDGGDNSSIGWGEENIMVLDEMGRATATYTYLVSDDMETYSWDNEGDVTFKPGDAFAIVAPAGLEVTIKKPYAFE